MHAFLLLNLDPIKFAQSQNAKVIPFTLQKIEDSRELKKLIKFSFAEKTAIVIENIDKATNEALNSFLKNLEEPGKNLIYILTASNQENVLPTIVSRCKVIKNQNITERVFGEDVMNFSKLTIDEKFEFVSKIKDRNEAINFIENLIYLDHQNKNFDNMENCLKTLNNLKVNGNVSLQLANFVVTMNR